MVSEETQSILQRKAARGTKEHEVRVMSVAKAMRLSIAKIGKELFEFPLSVIGAVSTFRKKADIIELMDDSALLCLLEGRGQNIGAAVIAPVVVGGLIQQQTMSFVTQATEEKRKMTQTDAAMSVPLLDAIFEYVAPMLENPEEKRIVTGYSFGARFEDARSADIALDAQEYFVIRLTLDLAEGKRQGDLIFILPNFSSEDLKDFETDSEDPPPDQAGQAPVLMADLAMNLSTELQIDLCRMTFELAQAQQLKIGDTLTLPHDAFPEAKIRTATGKTIGAGVLGQVNGMRALRVKSAPVHAKKSQRRAANLKDLNLPEITTFSETDKNQSEFVEDSGVKAVEIPSTEGAEPLVNPTPQNEELIDLPELDDLPNLAEIPDLAKVQGRNA